jgi:SAM-dependent methyltransferase
VRVTYRYKDNKSYWTKRWSDVPVDKPMENQDVYPRKYSELTIQKNDGRILEAGCGNGRILRYYHNLGYDIVGFDFINVAIEKLKNTDSTLRVEVGDITKLRFENESFKYLLAFGLYHNIENGLEDAVSETHRVLEKNGKVCASFRADNIQTRLTDWLTNRKSKVTDTVESRVFHKMNLTKNEFSALFNNNGFEIENIYPVENMPILYKFYFFRAKSHKIFNENIARSEGYKLSVLGQILQNILMKCFPNQFCNIYVLIARKYDYNIK